MIPKHMKCSSEGVLRVRNGGGVALRLAALTEGGSGRIACLYDACTAQEARGNLRYPNIPPTRSLPCFSLLSVLVVRSTLSPTHSPRKTHACAVPMNSLQERRRGPPLSLKPTPLFQPRRETCAASRSGSCGTKRGRRWACPRRVGTGFRRLSRSIRAGTRSRRGCSDYRARCWCKRSTSSRMRGESRRLTPGCRQTRSSVR